jgi:cell division protein FtsA
MRRNITAGIDVGTHITRVAIIEHTKDGLDSVIGFGSAPSSGIRRGYITNLDEATISIKEAINRAELMAKVKVKNAYVAIGGVGLEGVTAVGSAIVSRADQEVTILDINKAIEEAEETINKINKKVIHSLPISYKLDGKEIHGKPEGMNGVKIEVKVLFITIAKQHLEDLVTAVASTSLEVLDVIASPLAASSILLNEKQKAAGCALLDIGAESVNLMIFENGVPISLQVLQIGGLDITKDVALGFKVSLDEAEGIKIGSIIGDYPNKRRDEIIDARLGDIFELVENHLKRQKRSGLLPAGIIMTGGGSHIHTIEGVAKSYLRLPAKVGPSDAQVPTKWKVRDESWYVALGTALSQSTNISSNTISGALSNNVKGFKGMFKSLLSQLLP